MENIAEIKEYYLQNNISQRNLAKFFDVDFSKLQKIAQAEEWNKQKKISIHADQRVPENKNKILLSSETDIQKVLDLHKENQKKYEMLYSEEKKEVVQEVNTMTTAAKPPQNNSLVIFIGLGVAVSTVILGVLNSGKQSTRSTGPTTSPIYGY